MAIRIVDVELIPQNLIVGQTVSISVSISENDWMNIKDTFNNWQQIKDNLGSWIDLKNT